MSSKKTYLGLSFSSIMTKEMVVPKSWLMVGASNSGNMKGFNDAWFYVKKGYRNRNLYRKIEKKLGDEISGKGIRIKIDRAAENAWLLAKFPKFTEIISSNVGFITSEHLAVLYMQDTFGSAWQEKYIIKASSFSDPLLTSPLESVDVTTFYLEYEEISNGAITKVAALPNNFTEISYIATYHISTTPGLQLYVDVSTVVDEFSTELELSFVPIVPVQVKGRRAKVGSDKEKWTEWFMDEFGLDKELLYKELNKKEKDGNTKAIDYAFIMMGMEPRDPYVLPICGSSVKAVDIQDYPKKILDYAVKTGKRFNLPCGPETKRGTTAWWSKRHNMRRNKFAKMFYKMLKYYDNSTVNTKFKGVKTSTTFSYTSSYHEGKFLTRKGRPAGKGHCLLGEWVPAPPEENEYGALMSSERERNSQQYLDRFSIESDHGMSLTQEKDTEPSLPKAKDNELVGGSYVPSENKDDNNTKIPQYLQNRGIMGSGFGSSGPVGEMLLFKQISENVYEKITITAITQSVKISGESFTLNIDGTWRSTADKNASGGNDVKSKLFPQLWFPMHIYNKLDFTSAIIAREYGSKFLIFAKQVVKTSWFKIIIGIIIIIVLCYFATCAGADWVFGAMTGTTAVAGAAMAGGAMGFAAIAIYAVGMTALSMLVSHMLSGIDSPWARAIAQIVIQVVMMYFGGGGNWETFGAENYLLLATQVSTILYNAYIEIQMKDLAEQRIIKEAIEKIEDKQDMENQSELWKVDMSSHYSQVEQMSPDLMYRQMDSLYNYDQYWAVTDQLDLRVNVVPA